MRLRSLALFLVIEMFALAVLANQDVTTPEAVEYRVTDTPEEVKVPSELFDLVAPEVKPHLIFVPVTVVLKERTAGVLKEPVIRIVFPRGGGTVDFSKFLTEKQGSFFVKFEYENDAPRDSNNIYFISRSRKRKLDGEIYGSGCKKYMDVQSGIEKLAKKDGILVNTTRFRHLTVLGGSFIFSSLKNKDLRLSQVSFKDSNHPEYLCGTTMKEPKNEPIEGL